MRPVGVEDEGRVRRRPAIQDIEEWLARHQDDTQPPRVWAEYMAYLITELRRAEGTAHLGRVFDLRDPPGPA